MPWRECAGVCYANQELPMNPAPPSACTTHRVFIHPPAFCSGSSSEWLDRFGINSEYQNHEMRFNRFLRTLMVYLKTHRRSGGYAHIRNIRGKYVFLCGKTEESALTPTTRYTGNLTLIPTAQCFRAFSSFWPRFDRPTLDIILVCRSQTYITTDSSISEASLVF